MFYKKIILHLFISLAFAYTCKSQCLTINLINNQSLEEFNCCPNISGMISCAKEWSNPLSPGSTSDYYNACIFDSAYADPAVLEVLQYAYFGNGFAGIICCQNSPNYNPPYREYIQGSLSETLIENKCYYSEFWVKPLFRELAGNYFAAIDAIGEYFSDTLPQLNPPPQPFYFNAQVNNPSGKIILDTNNWTKISGAFVANGGEKYITVGTFKQESEISKYFYNSHSPNMAYYLFDNFSICPCEDTIPPKPYESVNIVYMPNIFSPNSDGANDILYVRGENIKEVSLSIYDRWGEKVFESNDKAKGWDGTYKGKSCPAEVYVYYVNVTFNNGITESKSGNVTLVR